MTVRQAAKRAAKAVGGRIEESSDGASLLLVGPNGRIRLYALDEEVHRLVRTPFVETLKRIMTGRSLQ